MTPTVYIHAQSKTALNVSLKAGAKLQARIEDLGAERDVPLEEMPDGTVVKIWQRRDGSGIPIAKSYGNVQRRSGKLVIA
jgi:hypothetical protein